VALGASACGDSASSASGASDGDLGDLLPLDDTLSDAASDADASADADAADTADTAEADTDADPPEDAAGTDATDADLPQDADAAVVDVEDAADGADTADTADTAEPPADCEALAPFDYTCDLAKPSSCPEGLCVLGICIGPKLDPDKWAACGDGTCEPCEEGGACPADCDPPPALTGEKIYDDPDTITVWVHGFRNISAEEQEKTVYGSDDGCGGLFDDMKDFGFSATCGSTPEGAASPDHVVKVEYFGTIAPDWMSPDDIAEVEAYAWDSPQALQRYALIVAKFIAHRLEISGAKYARIACHSMGCLLTRHLLENDYEGLASGQRIVRWASSAGVIAGARLARLYDNPQVQEIAGLIGLSLWEFVFMHPDSVADYSAVWDHKLYEANSPYLSGLLVHHVGATDPKIAEALNIQLLDLNNPEDEPNDGIMYTADEHFHAQPDALAFHDAEGTPLPPTFSLVHVDHMTLPKTDAFALQALAALYHSRKVTIRLAEVELTNDLESSTPFDGYEGAPPADLLTEVDVRFDPYVKSTFGKDVVVHQTRREHRSSRVWAQEQGDTLDPGEVLFEGPVLDAMQSLWLSVVLIEADLYPAYDILEVFPGMDPDDEVASFSGVVPLEDHTFEVQNGNARMVIEVKVHPLY
jgi:hypothetical protein